MASLHTHPSDTTPSSSSSQRTTINTSSTALWASAFVIVALIIIQAGRLPSQQAHADQATWRGAYSLLTASSGSGGDMAPNELLYIINNRNETLLVYEMEDARRERLTLRGGGSLRNLFIRAGR